MAVQPGQIQEDYHLTRAAKLNGDATVTYPYGTDHRRVERYFTVFRGTNPKDWKALDKEYSSTILIERSNLGGDQQRVHIYEVYEDLPGPAIADKMSENDHGPVSRTRQKIVRVGNEQASIVVDGGTVTRTTYEPLANQALLSKVVETYVQNGQLLKGQDYDRQLGIITPFTSRVEDFADPTTGAPSLGSSADVNPIDTRSSRVRSYDQAATNAALATIVRSAETRMRIKLPAVLLGVAVGFRVTKGEGDGSATATGYSIGDRWSLSATIPARSSSSVTITPEFTRAWKEFLGADNALVRSVTFFMHGNFTEDDVRTRLATITGETINDWPNFKAQGQDLTITGAQFSASATADAHRSKAYADSGATISEMTTTNVGKSFQTGGSSSIISIPPCIHGFIEIVNPTKSETLDVTATAVVVGGTNFAGGGASSSVPTQTVTASVSPTALPQTSPPAVPTSGLYLYDHTHSIHDSENWKIEAIIVPMEQFLSYTIFATAVASGAGTISGPGEYDPGATVTLVATGVSGHAFTSWKEGATTVSTSATYIFTAAADRVLTANFT